MSGFHNNQIVFQRDQRAGDTHEQVWSLSDQAIMSGNQEQQYPVDEFQRDVSQSSQMREVTIRAEEPLPPTLMHNNRTDSINSTTVFVNPNEIQPRPSHRYSGAPRMEGGSSGVKRRLSETESVGEEQPSKHATVILVGPDGRVQAEENIFLQEDISCSIPLGGSAETVGQGGISLEESNSNPSWTNPHKVEEGNSGSRWTNNHKVEDNNSNHSWVTPKEDSNSNMSWVTTTTTTNNQLFVPEHQLQQAVSVNHPSQTGVNPSTVNYPGHHLFDIKFNQISQHTKNKHWDFSSRLKKLFIDMNRWVQVEFRVGHNPPEGLFIRALPIYAEASHLRDPVKRCPNHASPGDATNADCKHPLHLIRFDGGEDDVVYCEDPESRRLSVAFPVQTPHQGSEFSNKLMKFMCLGSDVGGINRRPVKVIFTLEMHGSVVVGRRVLDVRICSCPKRDRQQEEARLDQQEEQARRIGQRLADTTAVINPPSTGIMGPPPPGKKKVEKDTIIMVPVHSEDFKKINEFSEAAWIMRDPSNQDRIKETRKRLLQEHNSQLIKKIEKKKPSQ